MVKNLIKMLLCATIFSTTVIIAYASRDYKHSDINNAQNSACNYKTMVDSTIIKKDSLRNLMIDEVQSFIDKKAPKAHKDIAPLLVDNGLQHDIDIAFMMAQAQYETSFGTAGAGRPSARYSLFGVNGKFKNYEDAINKYITLLKEKYLTKGKTEQHLMRNYTNVNGHRYSTNDKYESNLREYYDKVIKVSNIRDIQRVYRTL